MAKQVRWRTRGWRVWEIVSLLLAVGLLYQSVTLSYREQQTNEIPLSNTPLNPIDQKSPRALLLSFFSAGDDVIAAFNQYASSPSRITQLLFHHESQRMSRALDLSTISPAERDYLAPETSFLLWDILSRIPLPPLEEIPDEAQVMQHPDKPLPFWTIPNTEITLERMTQGPYAGQWQFSAHSVEHADTYFRLTRHLPYQRETHLDHDPRDIQMNLGGWLFPPHTVLALPTWLRHALAGQPGWKWLVMLAVYALIFGILAGIYTWAWRGKRTHRVWHFFRRLATPLAILAMLPALYYFMRFQIMARGEVGHFVAYTIPYLLFYLGACWTTWLVANLLGELIISWPKIKTQSTDAHLIRLSFRVGALGIIVVQIFNLGTSLGIPLYGLIAGAGVGTLAVALAAQSTLENFIGSLNLYADRPVSTGDFCLYGTERGTVEEIGLRSTRIRGTDRTMHTIPNAAFSKMALVNYTKRDRMLLRHTLRLRYETRPDQLRHLLAKLRELLIAHPRILAKSRRVRLIGIGDDALKVEIFAYVETRDWPEFLAVQEDVLLRVMERVAASGAGFALPSSTTYLGRDHGLDADRTEAAQATVAQWRQESRLPFPDHTEDDVTKLDGTLDYPPEGASPASGQR